MHFLRVKEVQEVNRETFAAFMRFLFLDKRLAPQTIASYKTALAKPMMFGWGINVLDDFFSGTLRAFHLQRPAVPMRPISWSLDPVLGLLGTVEYCTVTALICYYQMYFPVGLSYGGSD